jgi:ribosome-binding factor A
MKRFCAELGAFDGLDPRYEPKAQPAKVENRKALQLCSQVRRALSSLLAGDADEILRDLLVDAVEPAPNSTRLLLRVALTTLAKAVEPAEVVSRLAAAQGKLRCEVAAAIHRRRTPELLFQLRG